MSYAKKFFLDLRANTTYSGSEKEDALSFCEQG